MVAADPLDELVGAGADGVLDVLVVTDFVKVSLAGDAAQTGSHAVGERRVGAGQGHLDGVVVDDVALLVVDKQSGADGAFKAVVIGELDVLGGHLLAVVELHALAQVEGVLQAIVGDFIAFRQSGGQGAVGFQTQQAVIHVGKNQVIRAGAALLGLSEEPVGLIGRCQNGGVLHGAGLLALGLCSVGGLVVRSGGLFIGSVSGAAGAHGNSHDDNQQQCKNLLHSFLLFFYLDFCFLPRMASV